MIVPKKLYRLDYALHAKGVSIQVTIHKNKFLDSIVDMKTK